MACQTARYRNLGSQPIRFGIGSTPGKPWDRYDSAPGGVVEGPVGYLRAFLDAGYTLVTPEMQAGLDASPVEVVAAPVPTEPPAEPASATIIHHVEVASDDPDSFRHAVTETVPEPTPELPTPEVQAPEMPPARPVAYVPAGKGSRRGRNQ